MKRILFRLFVLAAITGLGLLAIAHAQRPAVPQPDDAPPNPLRQDAPPPVDNQPPNYWTQEVGSEVGPVDTAPALDKNPLRRRPPRPSESGPSRIRLIAGEEPADARTPAGRLQVPAGEPRLMPIGDDRYAVPSRAGNGRGASQSFSPEPTPMRGGRTSESVLHNTDGLGSPSYNAREQGSAQNGTGQPGDKQLEGPQNAQLVLQKMAPPEIQVGRPAVLRTVVRNAGAAPAADVEIHDQVPRGTRLLGTAPQAAQGPGGELVWSLGTLKPGGETSVEMQVMPTDEGEVGSVATVRFQTVATARSIVTRPKLAVETTGPQRVLAGDDALLTFTVSNPGSGIATGVTLVEHIPAGLKHPAGAELEYNVGDLKPGESRQLQLHLKAVQAGTINNVITARGDANLHAEHHFSFAVASPKLDVALNGPKRRYLEREATYQFSVANPGSATAKQVELVAYLPPGLKFVSANNAGRYDETSRAVFWQMDELPVNQHGTVELVTMPVAAGQFNLKVRGVAQRGVTDEKEQPVLVEGLASVLFQLSHTKDPLEIGGETTYEISVVNQGSKASTNLQMAVILPPELKPLAAEGPTRYTIQDDKVVFESLPQLAPKSVAAFRVRAKGIRAGDLRVRCQLMTDEMQRPVVKEESTRVYADE
jgi:uncharacterized repeat protein (TIGR01451 family)